MAAGIRNHIWSVRELLEGDIILAMAKYSNHSIHLLKPMDKLEIDRIFPKSVSKRKTVFRMISEGMTVDEWLKSVARAGIEKVDESFITQCYAKDEPSRYERKLVELHPPTATQI